MRNRRISSLVWVCILANSGLACGDNDVEETGSSLAEGDSEGSETGIVGGEGGSEGGDGEEGGEGEGEGEGEGSDDGTDVGGTDGGDDGGVDSGDVYADQACELLNGERIPLIAAATEAEASQALIVPSESEAWQVQSATDSGYVMLEVEDWMVTVRLFATEGVALEIIDVEQTTEQTALDGCKGYTDQGFEIHEWGSYRVHFEGASEFALSAIQEATGD